MGGVLWNIGAFIVALGLLVAVHEFGHFWVARRCGVKVERFSIGFGKAIWRRFGKDGTEYVLALIPLGGYVKMLDGRVDELKPGDEQYAFNHKSVWARMAIVAAGPMANFVFALFALWLMFMIGVPAVKPVVGEVRPASIVAAAGVEPGMEIVGVGGEETGVTLEFAAHLAGVVIDRFGKDVTFFPAGDGRFRAYVHVVPSVQFMGWLAGLGAEARLISPPEVQKAFCAHCRQVLQQYGAAK